MNAAMQTVFNTLKLSDQLFMKGVASLDDDTARRTVVDDTNNIQWLAGHLTVHRKFLLELFGKDHELPWMSKFREKYDPKADYPPLSEIVSHWKRISGDLADLMPQASDDRFDEALDWNLPNGDKTVRGALLFYMYHEAWHLGQIAYARRGMGLEGLVGR